MMHLMQGKSTNFINFFFSEGKHDGLKNAPKVTCLNYKDQVPLTSWEDHYKSCSLQLLTSYCLYYCTFELVLKFLGFFLLHVRKFKGTEVC